MPISETSLSARIVTEITAQKGAPQDPARLKQFADAVAKAVVDEITQNAQATGSVTCLLYTSPSPRDQRGSRMPSSA